MEISLTDLENQRLTDLYKLAKTYQIPYYSQMKKKELIFAILKAQAEKDGFMFMEGVLDVFEGYGFLSPINYLPSSEDIYISASQIRRFDLRTGDLVSGKVRPPKENERYFGLLHVEAVNGKTRSCCRTTPLSCAYSSLPQQKLTLETTPEQCPPE